MCISIDSFEIGYVRHYGGQVFLGVLRADRERMYLMVQTKEANNGFWSVYEFMDICLETVFSKIHVNQI